MPRVTPITSPAFLEPMLPSLVLQPPGTDNWQHEIKHDGFRTVLLVDRGRAQAFTRNGNDWTARYPGIVAAAAKLHCRSAVLDGEVIVQDEAGRSDFDALHSAIRWQPDRLIFFAFDLLFLDGKDLRDAPLEERRERLRQVLTRSIDARSRKVSRLQFSDHAIGNGPAFFAGAEAMGLEGIVSKRLDSRYRSGRTDRWRKVKCWTESSLILIGTEIDKRRGVPVALLARQDKEGLRYAGGAVFALKNASRDSLRARMARLSVDRSPIPALRKRGAQWIKPELLVRVRHLRGLEALRHATVEDLQEG